MAQMTTKEMFLKDFEIVKMNKNSLVLRNRNTEVLIHRNAFNVVMNDQAEDYRVVDRYFNGREVKWVEVLTWKAF